jgi:hypothetical protein
VSAEAAPGAYYGVVRFISGAGDEADGGNVLLNASVGTIFLVSVPGDTVELLSLVEISAADQDSNLKSVFSTAPKSLAIRLKNEGNTYIAPFGKVTVTDWTGNVVQSYELNDVSPRGNVLPDSIRRFDDELSNIGSFGRYKVEANISYGDGGNIITARTTFWVIPWVTLGIIALALVVVLFATTRGVKAYNNMIVKRSRGERINKRK